MPEYCSKVNCEKLDKQLYCLKRILVMKLTEISEDCWSMFRKYYRWKTAPDVIHEYCVKNKCCTNLWLFLWSLYRLAQNFSKLEIVSQLYKCLRRDHCRRLSRVTEAWFLRKYITALTFVSIRPCCNDLYLKYNELLITLINDHLRTIRLLCLIRKVQTLFYPAAELSRIIAPRL